MIPYQKEKRDNAICFFAKEHRARAGTRVTQTYLYKYLAFLDFTSVEKTGIPAIGLEYSAMKRGPVPLSIYNKRHCLKTALYEFRDEGEKVFTIDALGEPNLDYFSPFEIDIMTRLVIKYAKKYGRAAEISEDSHRQIKAWKKAYDKEPNGVIDYALTFDSDLKHKSEQELEHPEECYAVYTATKHASKCSRVR
jgi:uncharacterized phage-associated protein